MSYGTYSKGHRAISVEAPRGTDEHPTLWIGRGLTVRQVAAFDSEESATAFRDQLEYFFGSMLADAHDAVSYSPGMKDGG